MVFILLLIALVGCEKDEKEYYISFYVNSVQDEKLNPIPYEVLIAGNDGKPVGTLKSSDNSYVLDRKARFGETFHVICVMGPVEVNVSSESTTSKGSYEMEGGEDIFVEIDIE